MTPEHFLAFARLFPEPLLLLSATGEILAGNPPAAALFGLSSPALRGQRLADFVATPPAQVSHYLRACARTREMLPGALTLRTPEGADRKLRCEGAVVQPGSPAAPARVLLRLKPKEAASRSFLLLNQRITALAREVRERRRAEEAVRQQREQLRVTLASIGDAVIATDADGHVRFMNPVAQALTGWTDAEAAGKDLRDVLPIYNEATRHPAENPLTRVLREGVVVGLANHTVLVARDGSERPIDDSAAPIKDGQGRLLGAVLVFRDVTERRRAEAALRESEERFRTMADTAPVFIWMTGVDAGRTFFNKPWLEFTGRPLEQEHGDGWAAGVHDEDRQRCVESYLAAFRARQPFRTEYRLRRADGEYRWVLDTGVPRRTSAGDFAGYIGSCLDITERKHMEEALARQAADLARANADLRQFAYIAAHDLQEPLRMVSTYLQLLARRYRGKLDHEADEFIGYAVEGATRMHALLNDLLDYTQVETEGKPLSATRSGAVFERAATALRPLIAGSGATITHDPLPTVLADAAQLQLVFHHLLENALKFRRPVPPQIHLTARREGPRWLFALRDNGIGIEPQYAERIFDVFTRLHSRAKHPGTGIGLALCKKIIERHGGRIWVESEPGSGSSFFFTLPATAERSEGTDTRGADSGDAG
ncbi:MAG: PAS domain S-box protein [Thermodesulfobacteriota bacterium]|jgi:PAS domain S-box-containing protein